MKFLAPFFLFGTLVAAVSKKHLLFAKSCKLSQELAERKFPFSLNNGWTILEQEISHYGPMLFDERQGAIQALLRRQNCKTLPSPYKPNLFNVLTQGFQKTVQGSDESKIQIYTKNSSTFFWGKDEAYALVSLFIARNIIITEYNEIIDNKLSHLKDILTVQKLKTPEIIHKKRLFVLSDSEIRIENAWINETFEVVYIESQSTLLWHIGIESQKNDHESATQVSIGDWHSQSAIKFVYLNPIRTVYYRRKASKYFSSPDDNNVPSNEYESSSNFSESGTPSKKKCNKSEKKQRSRNFKGQSLAGTFSKLTVSTRKIFSKSSKKPQIDHAFIDQELKTVERFRDMPTFTLQEAQEFALALSRDMGPLFSLTVSLWNRGVDVDYWEWKCFNAVFRNFMFESLYWSEEKVKEHFINSLFGVGSRPSLLFNALVDINHVLYLHRDSKDSCF